VRRHGVTTNTTGVSLNNLTRPALLVPGLQHVYTGVPGAGVNSYTRASYRDKDTGACVDVNPDEPATNGRLLSFTEDLSALLPPFSLAP
jgi:hypothetical protein